MTDPAQRVLNYERQPDDPSDFKLMLPPHLLTAAPARVSLRNRFMPAVYDQGTLGSCTANAVGAAHEYMQRQQGIKDPFTPSRLLTYYEARALQGWQGRDSGSFLRDGAKVLNKVGAAPEALWPYVPAKFTQKPPEAAYTEGLKHRATAYRAVDQNLDALKGALAAGFPIAFGMLIYPGFMSGTTARTGSVPMPNAGEKHLGGHAMLIVGYDDRSKRFTVRNSWGTAWGLAGYCTVPYAYITDPNQAFDFWVIQQVEQSA